MKKTYWYEHLTPFLAAVFPVLSLALENIEFIQFSSILRSLIFSVLAAYIFYGLFYLILRNWRKSGVLSAILIFIFLSYGNVYLLLAEQFGEAVRHRYLMLIFAAIFILIALYVIFKVKDAKNLNTAVFTMGLVIFAYLLISVGVYKYREYRSQRVVESKAVEAEVSQEVTGNLPDIYLILLDAHTRSDVLRDVYDFDNSDFIEKLEDMGFFVADCAQSNYPGTNFSLGSLLEMDYFHNIYEDFDNLVLPPLNRTKVLQVLDIYDYSIITFDNYVMDHFDILEDKMFSREDRLFGSIKEFEVMLVETSILRILIDMEGLFPYSWTRLFKDDVYLTHFWDAKFMLDMLPKIPDSVTPQFVYSHLLVTHDPFVFLPDGSFGTSKQGDAVDYRNAVEYIDNTLPGIFEQIINNSEEPPIIILMGDHGATIKTGVIEDRLSILFGIYLQGEKIEGLHDDMTPINAFRIVFNYMLDANYELIDDRSYNIWNISGLGDVENLVVNGCQE